jgi:hypothetical protein
MLFPIFRSRKAGAALLEWRIAAFFLGAILGLAGIFLNISWLVTVALVVLLLGVAFRKARAEDSGSQEEEPRTPEP